MKFLLWMPLCAGLCVGSLASVDGRAIPDDVKQNGFAIGCQAYSFNRYSLFEAIEKTAEAGGKVIEMYPGQKFSREEPTVKWNHDATDEQIAKVKEKLKQHGITAINYGVVGGKDEAEWRRIFEFAKKMDLYGITTEDVPKLDIIEALVKEFDICVGIHNHPRKLDKPDYRVWDPAYILEVTKDRDPRIGACADTGHWQTSGISPVYALRLLKGRIISSHLKDKRDWGASYNVVYGEGVGEVGRCLDELKGQNFVGNISIEHEYNWEKSVPDITRCVQFVKEYQFKPAKPETPAAE